MENLIPRIWVGDDNDVPEAEKRGYSILAACKEGPNGHRNMLGYETLGAPKDQNYYFAQRGHWMALNLIDVDNVDFIPEETVNAGLNFLKQEYESGRKIFLHCNAGRSRGPTMAMMFLRAIGELPQSFPRAERIFRTLYSKYDPGLAMRTYAKTHWEALPELFKR